MPKVGLEPTRPRGQRILSPPRLPVPPLRLAGRIVETSPTEPPERRIGLTHAGHVFSRLPPRNASRRYAGRRSPTKEEELEAQEQRGTPRRSLRRRRCVHRGRLRWGQRRRRPGGSAVVRLYRDRV